MQARVEYRSLFWPLILIGIGIIWLLSNMGVLSLANISVVTRLWPLLLIVIGLDLLVGRRSPVVGAAIGAGALVVIIALMLIGPSLGWAADVDLKSGVYEEALGDAASARITVAPGVGEVVITPLDSSANLFEADIRYVGDVEYTTEAGTQAVVDLSQRGSVNAGIGVLDFLFYPDRQLKWDVRINPDLPLDLTVNAGTGGTNLDLSAFAQLTRLSVSTGTGGMDVVLPTTETSYRAEITAGTGGGTVRIEEGAAVELRVSSGTGGFTLDVPDGAAVRLVGSTGTGGISVPASFIRLGGDNGSAVGDSGTWETEGFANAARQIVIQFDGGTGGLTVH